MNVFFSERKKCYCAFCRSPRAIYRKRNIGFFDVIGSALGATVLMLILFQEFDPKVLLIFVAFLAVAETFVQVRWRLTIVCKYCGFDPVIYLKDTAKAVAKVKKRLEQRQNDPAALLAAPLKLPTLSKQKAELLEKAQAEVPGTLVNKRL